MTGTMYITQLSPELCLIVGACVAFLLGVSKNATTRSLVAPLTVGIMLLSMAATAQFGAPTADPQPAGLLFTPLTLYVRWISWIATSRRAGRMSCGYRI